MDKGTTLNRRKLTDYLDFRMMVFFIIFLLLGSYMIPISSSEFVNQVPQPLPMIDNGQILYAPMWTTTTYLIESTGTINHTWPSSYFPGVAVWWFGDGTILRTIRTGSGGGTGGSGGGVQKVKWDGTVVWDFRYNTNGMLSHHDVKTLPNGNVLLIAWETKTRSECIAAGRNPNYVGSFGLQPDHIIQVQPTGPSSGTIVWAWHAWDHLIQDYDPTKANYGVVGDHPELIDINYVASTQQDLMHTNSVDYNEEFDQILISVHNYHEIWIIDHSTTTAEAAGHTGGRYGKGGDLLYRWGNPRTYDRGTLSDEKLFSQHDATWIKPGCPGEGHILVFNNGANRPGSHYSSVDEIIPPVNASGFYYLASGSAYGPAAQTWIYTANPPTSFYASHISGAQRLPSGNTLICNGETGKIFEVTPSGSSVWQYNSGGQVFKVQYIPYEEPQPPEPHIPNLKCSGSLLWTEVEPGATVNGTFQVQNIGGNNSLLNWTINTSLVTWGTWSFTPPFGQNLTPETGEITVHVSVKAPDVKKSKFEGYLRVENQQNSSDFELIPVSLQTPLDIHPIKMKMTLLNLFLFKIRQWFLLIERISNKA